jgi:hypothetical protein
LRATQSPSLALTGRYLPLLYALVAALIAAPNNKAVVVIDVEGRFDVTNLLECRPLADANNVKQEEDNKAAAARPAQPSTNTPKVLPSDLQHVYVYKPARGSRTYLNELIASAETYMVYGAHGSRAREWWGTIVIGGGLLKNLNAAAAAAEAKNNSNANSTTTTPSSASSHNPSVNVTAGWKGWLRVDRDEVRGFPLGISVEAALAERARRQEAVAAAGWVASSAFGEFVFGGGGAA